MEYRKLYEYGVKKLQEAGIAEAELDARLLLEEICGTDRNTLLLYPDKRVSETENKNYVNYITNRSQRIPLQYIIQKQDFMGHTFYVNQNVLIPRQDTEILTEEVLRHVHDGMRILDVCTGSGCILISLLKYSNDCTGVGIDCSAHALAVARKNAEMILADSANYTFLCGDLFLALQEEQPFSFAAEEDRKLKFDIIVSNPPYIRSDVIPTLEPEVKEHEPVIALDGGEDGLRFYRRIIAEGRDYLNGGGMLFFEIGYDQADAVKKLMQENGYADVRIVKDYAGLDRVVFGTLLKKGEYHV